MIRCTYFHLLTCQPVRYTSTFTVTLLQSPQCISQSLLPHQSCHPRTYHQSPTSLQSPLLIHFQLTVILSVTRLHPSASYYLSSSTPHPSSHPPSSHLHPSSYPFSHSPSSLSSQLLFHHLTHPFAPPPPYPFHALPGYRDNAFVLSL